MIVVAADRLASPRIKVAIARVLDLVGIATRLEPLGLHLVALGVEVGSAFPLHPVIAVVGVIAA